MGRLQDARITDGQREVDDKRPITCQRRQVYDKVLNMGEISSGLVAVAEVGAGFSLHWTEPDYGCSCKHYDKLVRLSDAEAIISKQAERIKALEADADEEAYIRDRMAQLLAETAVALKGPEKALHRHGWQDLPDVAAKQSAALKLAKERGFCE